MQCNWLAWPSDVNPCSCWRSSTTPLVNISHRVQPDDSGDEKGACAIYRLLKLHVLLVTLFGTKQGVQLEALWIYESKSLAR